MGIGVAIELLHDAFLVHDDVADGNEMGCGRPALAARHGLAAALNAGDGLAIVAGQVLRKATQQLPDDLAEPVWHEFDTMALRTLKGAGHRSRLAARRCRGPQAPGLPRADHAQDVLVHHHLSAAGRRPGGLRGADLASLVRFGFHFCAAFQIREDLLNPWAIRTGASGSAAVVPLMA